MKAPGRAPRAGFTLVEVMLAMTILGIGLVVLLAAAGRSLKIADVAEEYEIARHLLARVDLENPIQLDEIDEGSDGGSFGGRFGAWRWQREIALYGMEEDEIYKVTTRVEKRNRRGGEGLSEEIVSLLHAPTALRNGWISDSATGGDFD